MIRSMTAFASKEIFESPLRVNVQIRSYNNRFLDICLKITENYRNMEEYIKRLIYEKMMRGRIEVDIAIRNESEAIHSYEVDIMRAKSYFEALKLLKQLFDLEKIEISTLLGADNIIKPAEVFEDNSKIRLLVGKCLEKVLINVNNMRKREGANIAEDLNMRLEYIEKTLGDIESQSYRLTRIYKDKLERRILELTEGLVKIDPDRILHEAAILANKIDITEEIVRSNSHIKQFKRIIKEDSPVGKKLNFLLQEFNREFNTMGSKVGNCDISYLIISIKSELEKIREQVQNIE